jgi:hypothetical protein
MIERNVRTRMEQPASYLSTPTATKSGRIGKYLGGIGADVAKRDAKKVRSYFFDLYRAAVVKAFQKSQLRQQELISTIESLRRWQEEAVSGVLALRDRKAQIEGGWSSLTAGSNNAGFRDWVPSRLTTRGNGNKLEKATTLLSDVFAVAMNSGSFSLETGGAWKAFSGAAGPA